MRFCPVIISASEDAKNATAEDMDSVGGTTCIQLVFSIASLFFPVTVPRTIIPGETQLTVI